MNQMFIMVANWFKLSPTPEPWFVVKSKSKSRRVENRQPKETAGKGSSTPGDAVEPKSAMKMSTEIPPMVKLPQEEGHITDLGDVKVKVITNNQGLYAYKGKKISVAHTKHKVKSPKVKIVPRKSLSKIRKNLINDEFWSIIKDNFKQVDIKGGYHQ